MIFTKFPQIDYRFAILGKAKHPMAFIAIGVL
jgi:hypothetical protein